MANLDKETKSRYLDMAEEHADFLCEEVFKPAFKMAFLHGAKHMYEEIEEKGFDYVSYSSGL